MGLLDRFVARKTEPSIPERRVRNLSTDDLALWIDNTVSQVGRSVRDYFTDGDAAHLAEARISVQTLAAMVEDLERRAE